MVMPESTEHQEVSPEEAAAEAAVVEAILTKQNDWRTTEGIDVEAFERVATLLVSGHPAISNHREFVRSLLAVVTDAIKDNKDSL